MVIFCIMLYYFVILKRLHNLILSERSAHRRQLRRCRSALLATPQRSCYGWLARTNKGVLHIMFSENLKTLRKQKGFSQEELAGRLHVVRQTISKWEKNLSVPDADTLIRLAEILEVSVSELLGTNIAKENTAGNVAEQLSRINEQLAIRNRRSRRIWKAIVILLASIILINLLIMILFSVPDLDSAGSDLPTVTDETTITGE